MARIVAASVGRNARSPLLASRHWLGLAVLVWLLSTSFLIKTFVIDSGSMEEALLVGDFVIVNRAAFGGRVPLTNLRVPGYAEPERGNILVFDPPHEDTLVLVERLIGLPGDTLAMRAKVLFLNGEAQNDGPTARMADRAVRVELT